MVIIIELFGPLILALIGYFVWNWLGAFLGFLVGRSLVAISRGYRTGPYLGTNVEFEATAWLSNNFSFSLLGGGVLGLLIGNSWFGAVGAVLGLIAGPVIFYISYTFFVIIGVRMGRSARGRK